ncbi:hypothetical protein A374_02764 [Fictibacillus macauensis ZFHKF-1]|uniref:Chemotaxis protein n=1 Tax=Fictibacillus macauensis ZFHKF-1 TaxID=1196324 RepID=I8UJT5_9BACL|nr:hypothetical protein [Fictibacillus macauensis]EIT87140.1 hypothetical protein A374_02764 [Fictibacillus macauensis ZFHKF-1]
MIKLAILILHGIGNQDETYADDFITSLTRSFHEQLDESHPHTPLLECMPVFWGDVLQSREEDLWQSLAPAPKLHYRSLREFVIRFLGDAIAYQPASHPHSNPNYERIHEVVARGLQHLRDKAGDSAPLTVISHSLGTIIASNYFYDLQYLRQQLPPPLSAIRSNTPLENGETLVNFYTMGSPLSLWTLRYEELDRPISVPSPALANHYPHIQSGSWLNYYDQDDVIAFPLQSLNDVYKKMVKKDVQINCGNLLTSWSPLAHLNYFKEQKLIDDIAAQLVTLWREVNP